MITFTEFSERLATGQLKNTSAVEEGMVGQISPEYLPTVLKLTNQGLVDLSTRFSLVTRLIDLEFQENQTLYAMNSSGVGTYLDESQTDTFIDNDFVKVLDIFDTNGVRHTHDTNGHIMTPTFDNLRFTKAKIEELEPKIRIRYQAKYSEIGIDGSINLPPNLVTGLQLFVSSLYISHMNGQEHSAKGDSYFAAYLRHIGEDEARNNSSTSEIDEDTRFQDRGFV